MVRLVDEEEVRLELRLVVVLLVLLVCESVTVTSRVTIVSIPVWVMVGMSEGQVMTDCS